jgi:hypothetical protein
MSRVLSLVLAHQPAVQIQQLLRWWSDYSSLDSLLIAYGGTEENFRSLPDVPRMFIDDARLKGKDLQREKQSYGGIWRATAKFLSEPANRDFSHIYFAEYDHLPVVRDIHCKLLERMQVEQADVLAHHLRRVDGTANPFYLNHIADPAFRPFWRKISRRTDKTTVLQMMGSASFWTREAFIQTANQPEEIKVYLELFLPSVAHHLGFRLRDLKEQNECVRHAPFEYLSVKYARQRGNWAVHPIKKLT